MSTCIVCDAWFGGRIGGRFGGRIGGRFGGRFGGRIGGRFGGRIGTGLVQDWYRIGTGLVAGLVVSFQPVPSMLRLAFIYIVLSITD